MITLITGQPGSGKTLRLLSEVKAYAEKEGRDVYYSGIADLKLPWIEFEDPAKWPDLPDRSIIIIDECQRLFRTRANGSQVPRHVSELETHRHRGIDLFFVTQHPTLIDANVRRLVGRHLHVIRAFGLHKSIIHEWTHCRDNPDKQRSDSVKHVWPYPKEVFTYYKSAEIHTHKARIPFKVLMFPVLIAAIGYLAWSTWSSLEGRAKGNTGTASAPAVAASNQPGQPGRVDRGDRPMTTAEYIEQYQPRLPGLPHTAPRYDQAMKVVNVPQPQACVATKAKCTCYTDQGTRLDTPDGLCRSIVADGYFMENQPMQPEARQSVQQKG